MVRDIQVYCKISIDLLQVNRFEHQTYHMYLAMHELIRGCLFCVLISGTHCNHATVLVRDTAEKYERMSTIIPTNSWPHQKSVGSLREFSERRNQHSINCLNQQLLPNHEGLFKYFNFSKSIDDLLNYAHSDQSADLTAKEKNLCTEESITQNITVPHVTNTQKPREFLFVVLSLMELKM